MKNKAIEFYASLRSWIRAAFVILQRAGEQVTYIEKPSIRPSGFDPDFWDECIEPVPNFYWTFQRHGDALDKMPETQSLRRAIVNNAVVFEYFQSDNGELNWMSVQILLKNLMEALWNTKSGFGFRPTAFDRVYARLERFLYSKEVQVRVIAPLENFTSSSRQIKFSDGLVIRQLPDEELRRLYRDNVAFRSQYAIPDRRYMPAFAVELRQTVPKPPRDQEFPHDTRQQWTNAIHAVVSVLRLFKPGDVRCAVVEFWQGREDFLGTPVSHYVPAPLIFGPVYEVHAADVVGLKRLFVRFRNVDWRLNRVLSLALSRFNLAAERQNHEDRILDLMIAMEAIFLPDGNEELTFRLALRAARLLEPKDSLKRKKLFDDLREAYKVRSSIVHGTVPSKRQKMSVEACSNFLDQITRDTLKKAMTRYAVNGQFSVDWASIVLG